MVSEEEYHDQEEEVKGGDEDLVKYIEELIGMMSTGDDKLDRENIVMLVDEMH